MNENLFFKPTILYKEYTILDLIEKNPYVTQRALSESIGSSFSMINLYIQRFEKRGLIKKIYLSSKTLKYNITKKGVERKKLLNISYLKSSYEIYTSAKENILLFLRLIYEKGFKKIILYGAGEVSSIILNVVNEDRDLPIKIVCIIDDDINKFGKMINKHSILEFKKLFELEHDGVLISSYTHNDIIYKNLLKNNYNKNKIITFFDL